MQFLDVTFFAEEDTPNQRWGNLLALAFCAVALLIGFNMRNDLLYATTAYINVGAGIRAEYPQNWLIDETGDYVFRVRDMSRIGFKTSIQVAVLPFTASMTPANVLTDLSLARSSELSNYRPLSTDTILIAEEEATVREYSYIFAPGDPFLEPLASSVIGRDILFVRRGQAILITFLADARTFDEDVMFFDRFLTALEF
jgi:hypothetical protein